MLRVAPGRPLADRGIPVTDIQRWPGAPGERSQCRWRGNRKRDAGCDRKRARLSTAARLSYTSGSGWHGWMAMLEIRVAGKGIAIPAFPPHQPAYTSPPGLGTEQALAHSCWRRLSESDKQARLTGIHASEHPPTGMFPLQVHRPRGKRSECARVCVLPPVLKRLASRLEFFRAFRAALAERRRRPDPLRALAGAEEYEMLLGHRTDAPDGHRERVSKA